MTPTEALKQIKSDCIPGVRGVGTMTMVMTDGRVYNAVDEDSDLVARYADEGGLIERIDVADVVGDVSHVSHKVDESGSVYLA